MPVTSDVPVSVTGGSDEAFARVSAALDEELKESGAQKNWNMIYGAGNARTLTELSERAIPGHTDLKEKIVLSGDGIVEVNDTELAPIVARDKKNYAQLVSALEKNFALGPLDENTALDYAAVFYVECGGVGRERGGDKCQAPAGTDGFGALQTLNDAEGKLGSAYFWHVSPEGNLADNVWEKYGNSTVDFEATRGFFVTEK
ncbi:hypothetical protein R6G78_08490 [Actinotignum timonense]|uniref:hypothetical protein n=1 Tax=Actinotignum timonense TaxID=1870995 RepID=UPI002A83AEB6|nr:hypothetical protein [Actinotignum timonense]MDY5145244.1 hypothetical protein [Actinotignum timonense]